MIEVKASDHVDPDGLIVKSGELLAQKVIELLQAGDTVKVELRGLSGISSSYFNIFLQVIQESQGPAALERIKLDFVSPLQEQVFVRSRDAVLKDSTLKK